MRDERAPSNRGSLHAASAGASRAGRRRNLSQAAERCRSIAAHSVHSYRDVWVLRLRLVALIFAKGLPPRAAAPLAMTALVGRVGRNLGPGP